MKRLVYYSVSASPGGDHGLLLWQLSASIRSLRRYNRDIPIAVFVYDYKAQDVVAMLEGLDVIVYDQGEYVEKLEEHLGGRAQILAEYPILHKWLNLRDIPSGTEQVLVLDCDTVFFGDAQQLFDAYIDNDCYAREEAFSRRNHYGYDAHFLDEDLLQRLGKGEGFRVPDPFNCGVVLFNRRALAGLRGAGRTILSYAWRFSLWMAANPLTFEERAKYAEGRGIGKLRECISDISTRERATALRFPSVNRWLLDEVSLWMTLGEMGGLTVGDFDAGHVLEGGELRQSRLAETSQRIVWHYYTSNLPRLSSAIHEAASLAAGQLEKTDRGLTRNSSAITGLLESRLVADGGYAVYDNVIGAEDLALLRAEAVAYQARAHYDSYSGPPRGENRDANPARRFSHTNGGPIQERLFSSPEMLQWLSRECDSEMRTTAGCGTYSYYLQTGDFIGLHLDRTACDVVIITMLHDDSSLSEFAGALVVFPRLIGKPLSQVSQSTDRGVGLKVLKGQSIVLCGGLVPHYVAPVGDGHKRVISVTCYEAL